VTDRDRLARCGADSITQRLTAHCAQALIIGKDLGLWGSAQSDLWWANFLVRAELLGRFWGRRSDHVSAFRTWVTQGTGRSSKATRKRRFRQVIAAHLPLSGAGCAAPPRRGSGSRAASRPYRRLFPGWSRSSTWVAR